MSNQRTPRKQPVRTCVACRTGADKRALLRFVCVHTKDDAGTAEVQLDPTGRKPGRGAYLCVNGQCFNRAYKTKALERALRCSITPDEYERLAKEFAEWCSSEHRNRETVVHG